jgi:bla regulator protein blaR1
LQSLKASLLVTVIATFMASSPSLVLSQTSAASLAQGQPLPSFAVASIKPDNSGRDNSGNITRLFQFPGPGRFHTVNIPASLMIQFAYDVSYSEVVGGPRWIESQGFIIDAKIDDSKLPEFESLSPVEQREQMRLMVQSLLANRFNLVLRRGTKQMQMYALVVAKGGPKLTPTQVSDPNEPPPSGARQSRGGAQILPGKIIGVDQSMSGLAESLSSLPDLGGHVVRDRTGIKGSYDFDVEYTPENQNPPAATDATAPPSIFTALEEQLGLRLESSKGPVLVYTIDHIEQPSAD